jgi:hypothetical protein
MSPPIRVYLPATMPDLVRLHGERALAATQGYAMPEQPGDTDEEELSYAAYRQAADASLRLLRTDPGAPRRRVVIAADVQAQPAGDGDLGAVRLTGPVPISAVAAIHVDGAAAEPAVAAALAAGDDSVDDELEWYDVSELPQLLA